MNERGKRPIFTEEDRLRLLQLMTRRAMVERRTRPFKREDNGGPASARKAPSPAQSAIPHHWQLIPEGVSLYDWQHECLSHWLKQRRGTVKVATGGGKTLFALAVAQHLQNEQEPNLRLVVVVPTIPLMFQWYDEIRRGNLPDSAIGLMGGGQDLPPISNLRVLICVLNSARERLPALVKKARWAQRMLLVVDECHRANAAQARRIFDARAAYTLGLSATPEQELEAEVLPSDEAYEKSVVGEALGPIIYDFTIQQSLQAELLTPFEVWHIGLPLSQEEAKEHAGLSREISELRKVLQLRHRRSRSKQPFLAWCQTLAVRGGVGTPEAERFIGLANERKRLLYRAKARTEVTLGLLRDAVGDPESRIILFHESIEEIESLFLECANLDLPVVLEHSQLPDGLRAENIEAFRRGTARIIISAKSLIEGFNVPSADLGIIVASTSSVRQRIQSLGRLLRRKPGARGARIVVLYVRDSEDEAIYEKTDWESVIGTERNRYFNWNPPEPTGPWSDGLGETGKAPRIYRPSSWEVDVNALKAGDLYSGQTHGSELKVDQSGNLRTEDSRLVPATSDLVEMIVDLNLYRRARLTPAGHLIVCTEKGDSEETNWRYLGTVQVQDDTGPEKVIRLRVKRSAGRRVIALEDERRKDIVRYALGPGESRAPESGQARERILEWIRGVEAKERVEAKDLFWDGQNSYWLELGGKRIYHEGVLPSLEFRE